MTNEEILAHAEALANMRNVNPTDADFDLAEGDVLDMLRVGMTYTETEGWH